MSTVRMQAVRATLAKAGCNFTRRRRAAIESFPVPQFYPPVWWAGLPAVAPAKFTRLWRGGPQSEVTPYPHGCGVTARRVISFLPGP